MKSSNPRAFPASSMLDNKGMTLRDYFASKAMNGLISYRGLNIDIESTAERAYEIADALLKQREKTNE